LRLAERLIACSTSNAFTKSGTFGAGGMSNSLKNTCFASAASPAFFQHVPEAYALPFRVARRAAAELPTRHARLEKSATVSAALVHRGDLDRSELRPHFSEHLHVERIRGEQFARERRAGEVAADEERVVRC
jgi:hypothetical protein